MPRLGESINEGTVGRWLKRPGDTVALMEPLLEISTEKIDTEIPSPAAGTLLEVRVPEGETVAVGTVLAVIGTSVRQYVGTSVSETPESQTPTTDVPTYRRTDAPTTDVPITDAPTHRRTDAPFYSPVVQKIAAEERIDLARVAGTGIGGRVTRRDVEAWLIENAAQSDQPASHGPDTTIVPLTAMRRAIAQHMTQSVRTSPHVATLVEVDMSAEVRHREAVRADFAAFGLRLTYTAYFVHAVAQTLPRHPLVNGRFTEEGILHNRRVHVGVAVALGDDGKDGLIVPVLRDAERLSLEEVARALHDLTERARSNRLMPNELEGGTFTVTNHGVGGSLLGTPIIVQPQAAILGIGAIQKRPVIRSVSNSVSRSLLPSADDAIVIRPMCYLTLSFDHRIVDGATADAFLRDVQLELEMWRSSNEQEN